MSFAVRQAWSTDLDAIVDLVADCQADPEQMCFYLSTDPAALRVELQDVDGFDDWTTATWVALDDARNVIGCIGVDADPEIGRLWWRGPFVSDASSPLADAIADGLFSAAVTTIVGFGGLHDRLTVTDGARHHL